MKKIVSILFVALIALAFMGCPSVYEEEYDYANPVAYIAGSALKVDGKALTEWDPASGKMTYNPVTGYIELDNVEIPAESEWKVVETTNWGSPCVTLADSSKDWGEANGDDPNVANIVMGEDGGTFLVQYDKTKKEIILTAK